MAASNGPSHGRAGSPEEGEPGTDRSPALLHSIATDSTPQAVRGIAFWSAVILPFLHVPLLTTGLSNPGLQRAFVLLLVANAVALYAGHGYGTE